MIQQPLLSEQAKELGAIVENALTISVTHVVAAGYGSPKYLVSSSLLLCLSYDTGGKGKATDLLSLFSMPLNIVYRCWRLLGLRHLSPTGRKGVTWTLLQCVFISLLKDGIYS